MPKPKHQDESAGVSGTGELPTPDFDETSGQQPLPSDAEGVEARFKSLEEKLTKMEKQWQQDKDRRIPKMEQKIEDIGAVLSDYKKLVEGGTNPELAEWLIERLAGQVSQVKEESLLPAESTVGADVSERATTEALGELEKYGLSANEEEFIKLLRGRYSSIDAFRARIRGYILERVVAGNKTQGASVSGVAQGSALEEQEVSPENPIADIEDSRTLYGLHLKDVAKKRRGR